MNESAKSLHLQLDGKGSAEQVKKLEVTNHVRWSHINPFSSQTKSWLKQIPNLTEQAKSMLLARETRPRMVPEDKSISLCLRGINLNNDQSPEDMIAIRIWFSEQMIITSCGRSSQSITRIGQALGRGDGPKTTADLLMTLIEQLGLLTVEFIEKIDHSLDQEEDGMEVNCFEQFIPKMSQLRRQIAAIRRFMAPQKEALDRLYRSKSKLFNENFYDELYVQIDQFTYLLENLDLLKERALVLQEQFMANISHQQNSRLYLLAIISAIFLPLTFLSGLLGMNVGGMPGVDAPTAFWIVSGFCLVVMLVLMLWFKRKNWF